MHRNIRQALSDSNLNPKPHLKNIQREALAYQSFDSYQSSDDVEESREDYDADASASAPPASAPQPAPEFVRLADFFERCVLLYVPEQICNEADPVFEGRGTLDCQLWPEVPA